MAFYRATFYAKRFNMDFEFNIILPDDLKQGEKIPTLFLLHGYLGNHQQWMRFSSIERYSWRKRMAIIMPEGQNGFYIDHVDGHQYFQALIDLMDHVRKVFPLSDKREDTYVAGLSMGGYGAFKWALTYPELFSKAASLSGALDIFRTKQAMIDDPKRYHAKSMFGDIDLNQSDNNLYVLLNKHLKEKNPLPELFIACGTEDFLFEESRDMHQFLTDQNLKHRYIESPGDHNWDYWDKHIQDVIEWL